MGNPNPKALMGALPIVGAAFGRKFGVPVVVGGYEASTNGRVIWLPMVSGDLSHLLWALLAHEAGHIRFTDFSIKQKSEIHHFVRNAIEDVRIENEMIRIYPGTRSYMDDLFAHWKRTGELPAARADAHPGEVVGQALICIARYRYRRQRALKDLAETSEKVLRQVFPASFVHRLNGLMAEIPAMTSTAEVSELAERIVALIAEESKPPQPQPQPQPQAPEQCENPESGDGSCQNKPDSNPEAAPEDREDDGSDSKPGDRNDDRDDDDKNADSNTGSGDDADSQDDAGASDPSDGGDSSEDDTNGDSQSGAEGEDDTDPDADQPENPRGGSDSAADEDDEDDTGEGSEDDTNGGSPSDADGDDDTNPDAGQEDDADADADAEDPQEAARKAQALEEALNAGEQDLPKDLFTKLKDDLRSQGNSHGYSPPLLPAHEDPIEDLAQGTERLDRVLLHSAGVTARLTGLVQSHTQSRTRELRRGHRLNGKKLHRLSVSDPRVFVRQDERQAPNTALHLLLDCSGSMGGHRIQVALDATLALAIALERIPGVSRAVTAFPGVSGDDAFVSQMIRHGESARARARTFVDCHRGGTPMTGAIWFAAADLLARRENRKVILVVTDGDPDSRASTVDIVQKCTAAGVEVIGVGIGVYTAHLFPVGITINGVADLKTQLFQVAENLLIT